MIYLDNAATTFPKPEFVYKAIDTANREFAVNAGRGSYKVAKHAANTILSVKDKLRNLVNADASVPVVLSPSVTVALNQIIFGYDWKAGSVIYVSPYEHNAVARTINYLAKGLNIKVRELPMNEDLTVDLDRMQYMFGVEHPDAVICTHISNVTGYILPIEEIFDAAKKYNCLTVVDASQSLGLLEVNSKTLNADIIAFTGHKTLYGPLGIGGFLNISNVEIGEYIVGGNGSDSLNLNLPKDMEAKLEVASPNIVSIAGLNAALDVLDRAGNMQKEIELTKYLREKLIGIPRIVSYLPKHEKEHIGVVSFNMKGYKASDIGMILDDDFDIAVRTGYHCAPYIHKYLDNSQFLGTVRVGLGCFNTVSDIDSFIEALEDILES